MSKMPARSISALLAPFVRAPLPCAKQLALAELVVEKKKQIEIELKLHAIMNQINK